MKRYENQQQSCCYGNQANDVGRYRFGLLGALTRFLGRYELTVKRTGFAGLQMTGFNNGLPLQAGALEFVRSNSACLPAGWSRSRPSHKLATTGDHSESKLGFKTGDGAPSCSEYAQWVSNFNGFGVEADSGLHKEQPNQNVKGQKKIQAIEGFDYSSAEQSGNKGQNGYGRSSSDCVTEYSWTNHFHALIIAGASQAKN